MAEKEEEEEMRTVGHAFHTRGRFGEEVTIHVLHAGLQMGMGGVGMGGLLDLHY